MTATARIRAESNRGCAWPRRSGLSRDAVESLGDVLPGVRFAVDAYVNFARRAPWHGSGVLLADRAVRAGNPQAASRELAGALSVDRPRRAAVLPEPRQPGAPRRGIQSRVHPGTFRHAPAAGTRARHSEVQARCAVADERCDGAALCDPSHHGENARQSAPGIDAIRGRRSNAASGCSGSPRRTRTCCSIPKAWSSSTAARGRY